MENLGVTADFEVVRGSCTIESEKEFYPFANITYKVGSGPQYYPIPYLTATSCLTPILSFDSFNFPFADYIEFDATRQKLKIDLSIA